METQKASRYPLTAHMFRRISYRIALQFTAFVFLLMVVNGSIFLASDAQRAQHETREQLQRVMQNFLSRAQFGITGLPSSFPVSLRERVRVLDAQGRPIFSGNLFSEIPFRSTNDLSTATVQNERYAILTASVVQQNELTGYVQVAQLDSFELSQMPTRALNYLLVSLVISLLTFSMGLFFARRSLEPASQAMQRLEQFTQDASHELRTPLAALTSSIDLALKTGKLHEGLESAKEDVHQVNTLVERLLDLARLDRFTLAEESVDMSTLVSSVMQKYEPIARSKSVSLASEIRHGVAAQGDEALLRQVIGNLLSNAIKFNRANGQVTVELTRDALRVADTGIGIAAGDLPHLFDRFFQADTSRANQGFGLGLALVKRIVDLHRWSIDAQSEVGKGTTFTIHFKPA